MDGMKMCSRCNTEKPVSEFYKNKTTSDGYAYYCKACEQARQSDYLNRKSKGEVRSYGKKVELHEKPYKVPRCQILDGEVQQLIYLGCRCQPGQRVVVRYLGSIEVDNDWVDKYEGECVNCGQSIEVCFK